MKKIIILCLMLLSLPLFSQQTSSALDPDIGRAIMAKNAQEQFNPTTVDTVKVNPLQAKLEKTESDVKMFRALALSLLIKDKEPNDLIVDLYLETQVLKGQIVEINNQIKGFVEELSKAKDEVEVMAILKKYNVRD